MAEERPIDGDFLLWAMIIQARDVLFRARDNELSSYGITAVEARALYIIKLIGNQATPATISRWMLREHNTVTALLTRMESKGFITRTKNPKKKNTWRISLTEKGIEAYQKSLERTTLRESFSTLDDEERKRLIEILQKICDHTLKNMMTTPPVPR